MGSTVAHYTGDIRITGDVLKVQIKSPALRQNLLMMRTEIARKMNDYVKAQVIGCCRGYLGRLVVAKYLWSCMSAGVAV